MKYIETIKALLAKAAATNNEHEAEAFAAKASEMMEKYQISADTLGAAGDEVGVDNAYNTKQDTPVWQNRVAYAAGLYFGCECVHDRSIQDGVTTRYIGRESARITALEMLPYFIATINRLAREIVSDDAAKGIRSHQRATAHRIGMLFSARLRDLAPPREQAATKTGGAALVLLDRQVALKKELYPNLGIGRSSKYSVTAATVKAAAGISIARQTGGRGAALRIA